MKMENSEGLFNNALQVLYDNHAKKQAGGVNCIPLSGMERLSNFLPGIEKRQYIINTANSGVGKSRYTKEFYVLNPVDFVLDNPGTGIKLKVFYFCLEESKINFMHSMMVYKLYTEYGRRVPIKNLRSIADPSATFDDLEQASKLHRYFEHFNQMVEVHDQIRNPYGIYKVVHDYMEKTGSWSYRTIETAEGPKEVKHLYTPNHADQYVLVVIDHISLIQPEKGKSLHESISDLSSTYLLNLRDKYGCTPVVVQQQKAAQEQKQFTTKGVSIHEKLEPTLEGLAENKLTGRDADVVVGQFAPERYRIGKHLGYDVSKLQDHFRTAIILKSRDGISNARLPLFYDGAMGRYEELPPADSMTDELYESYLNRVNNDFQSQTINFN